MTAYRLKIDSLLMLWMILRTKYYKIVNKD